MDPDKLFGLLKNEHLWLVLGVAFVFGAVGALIHRDSNTPSSETTPGARSPSLHADVLTGGIAAMAILYVTDPLSGVALIGGALVAGYAAKIVLAGLEARVTSVIAQRDASDSKRQADAAKRTLETLADHLSALPEPGQPAGDDVHLTLAKQLAQDVKAQLSLH
jgi:hypothetical protein